MRMIALVISTIPCTLQVAATQPAANPAENPFEYSHRSRLRWYQHLSPRLDYRGHNKSPRNLGFLESQPKPFSGAKAVAVSPHQPMMSVDPTTMLTRIVDEEPATSFETAAVSAIEV
jgi:hypothetical protein